MLEDFESLDELYRRVYPALTIRVRELKYLGREEINEKAIWNFLSIHKWKNSKNLTLYDIINDIFHYEEEVDTNDSLR
jgi:hypothetical protein